MRKIYYSTFLATFMLFNSIKPLCAKLTFDGGNIAQEIASIATQITETANSVQNEISVINEIKAKGEKFNPKAILALKNTLLGKISIGKLSGLISNSVGDTKEKQFELASAKLELEEKTSEEYYNKKIENISDDLEKVNARIIELSGIIPIKEKEVENKRQVYEATPSYARKKLYDEYSKANSELNALYTEKSELESMAVRLRDQYIEAQKAKSKIKTEDNKTYQKLKKQHEELKALALAENVFGFTTIEIDKDERWDNMNQNDEKYSLSDEKYERFLNLYFYDPDDIGTGEYARLKFQTQMDQITRNRKYLTVNTAAHLLQVTATARREIATRQASIFEYWKKTIDSDNGIDRSRNYGITRIEEARATLLLAKILSAKLQYLAARELSEIEVKKDWKDGDKIKRDYSKFDLGRYILTKEYVKKEYKRRNGDKK